MDAKYSNLLQGFIQELDDCYVLMKKKREDNKLEVEYIFKDMENKKLDSIKEVINDIQVLIDERQKLRDEIFVDMDKMILSITNFLNEKKEEMKPEEVVELKRKVTELEQAKTQEKLNAWRDVSNLKKELRDHLREFKDKKDNFNVLESMVDL
ncbi:hypothetical protein JXB28_00440 [Candidatus Woesearchaeota archaeon]|nr:hypothetical protein [Candidatus Woesearchaeota archaeon]